MQSAGPETHLAQAHDGRHAELSSSGHAMRIQGHAMRSASPVTHLAQAQDGGRAVLNNLGRAMRI